MPPPPPRALLLDFNGTLCEETPPRHVIYAQTARRKGIDVADADVLAAMKEAHAALPRSIDGHFRYTERWFHAFVEFVFARLGRPDAAAVLFAPLIEVFSKKDTFRPFAEVVAVLKRVKGARIPLAVVSNWGPRLPAILTQLGLANDFAAIVASAIVRMEKPDPAIFRRAASLVGVAPKHCLHVGDDAVKDVEGARAAGMDALLLDRSGARSSEDGVVATLDDVLPRFSLPRVLPQRPR